MKIPQVTKEGRLKLGSVLKRYREEQGWTIDELVQFVDTRTGMKISKSAISNLERGNTVPNWDTLSILACSGYLPYSANELMDIATEGVVFKDIDIKLFNAEDVILALKALPKSDKVKVAQFLLEAIAV
jgi:transcriptional regulator with XRE-family HTH domain